MEFIDGETGLPDYMAQKLKKIMAENQMLKNRIQELETIIANMAEKVTRIEEKIK